VVAHFGKAGTGDETDVARSDDRHFITSSPGS
jgi:hypothetical protein